MPIKEPKNSTADSEEDRRQFLKNCGRFAVSTPPLVTTLLSTSLTSDAIAKSGTGGGRIGDHKQAAPRQDGAKQGRRRDGHRL
ncbi:hypothetical protein [Sinorhizobium arboris]|uniref:hypothetical protein n=1 Tax=Sinorhizobium arboris TaxID=76745 RepID=UPI0004132739|nr:hypothetical protein [Sinorhizobium arboris]